MTNIITNLEAMLAQGKESALLRYGLGNAYFNDKQYALAKQHLIRAVEIDPNYTAAWKLYAKSLTELGEKESAITAYQQGIAIAEQKGDMQAWREMNVFLKRLTK